MNVMIPFQNVKGMSLETFVKDCISNLPSSLEIYGKEGIIYMTLEETPKNFENTPIKDLFFLNKPVYALTSRKYLESVDQQLKLASLFQEKGDFFPFNPKVIKKIRR